MDELAGSLGDGPCQDVSTEAFDDENQVLSGKPPLSLDKQWL